MPRSACLPLSFRPFYFLCIVVAFAILAASSAQLARGQLVEPVSINEPDAHELQVIDRWEGISSALINPRQDVIRTTEAWKEFWPRAFENFMPPPLTPDVDFEENMVVGVFMGVRNTGGYSTEIISVNETPDAIIVSYRERSPGPDDIVTEANTNPYSMVAVPKRDKDVEFKLVD